MPDILFTHGSSHSSGCAPRPDRCGSVLRRITRAQAARLAAGGFVRSGHLRDDGLVREGWSEMSPLTWLIAFLVGLGAWIGTRELVEFAGRARWLDVPN